MPEYRVAEHGPDHDKRFEAVVVVQGEARGHGAGRSKKEAEQQAAATAFQALDPTPDVPPLPPVTDAVTHPETDRVAEPAAVAVASEPPAAG